MDLHQNWQLAADPPPIMVAVDDEPKEFTDENPVIKQEPVFKQEIKEEPISDNDSEKPSMSYAQLITEVQIKEEPIDHHNESQQGNYWYFILKLTDL